MKVVIDEPAGLTRAAVRCVGEQLGGARVAAFRGSHRLDGYDLLRSLSLTDAFHTRRVRPAGDALRAYNRLMDAGDRPVFVVDLREEALREDRRALEEGSTAPPLPQDEPIETPIDTLAVLHDGSDEPLLLPLLPTRDREELDAIARLLRFAVLLGKRIGNVAADYGNTRERQLLFERRLPAWVHDGIDASGLPPALARVLGRRGRRRK